MDEQQKKEKQYSITKKSPLFSHTKESEDDVGIEIHEFENTSYGDSKVDAKSRTHERATEFPKRARAEEARAVKFGDAILTKPEDVEVLDARYEINLLDNK